MPSAEVRQRIQHRLDALHAKNLPLDGAVARYYDPVRGRGYDSPTARSGEEDLFAISLATLDGEYFCSGDHDVPFAIQSVSKVFSYGLALADHGRDRVLERVGVEPSGDPFNGIAFDQANNRPYNPMVNAGAMLTSELVRGIDPAEKLDRILAVMRLAAANDGLEVDEATFEGEMKISDRNRAIAYLMHNQGMLEGEVEDVLRLYLRQCAVAVTCKDLAVMAATLANGCVNPITGDRVLPQDRGRDVLSVMFTCGMYDAAGQWTYDVGVPAKSGVSGCVIAVIPGKGGIGVYSPGLDAHGNSIRGVRVCREVSDNLGLHVFAGEDEDAILGRAEPSESA